MDVGCSRVQDFCSFLETFISSGPRHRRLSTPVAEKLLWISNDQSFECLYSSHVEPLPNAAEYFVMTIPQPIGHSKTAVKGPMSLWESISVPYGQSGVLHDVHERATITKQIVNTSDTGVMTSRSDGLFDIKFITVFSAK